MPIQLSGSLAITGSMVATGQITAQTLVVQTITSSVSFITGSTKFGNSLSNTHQFTGSVSMVDNLNVSGTIRASSEILADNLAGVVFNRDTVGYVKLRGDNTGAGSLDGGDYVLKTGIAYYGDVVTDNYLTYGTLSGSFAQVGIGTTAPEVKLDVKGTSTGTLTGMALFRDASTNGNGLLVRAGTGVVNLLATWIDSGINTDLTLTPTTSGGTQNEAMRITSAGNIGIGTTSPNARLDVSGSTTISGSLTTRGLLVTGSDAFFNSVRVGRGFGSVATNTAVGVAAISGPTFANVTGTQNVGVGRQALTLLKTGNDNTAIGYQALASGSIGNNNTAVGSQALYFNVSGSNNTAVGYAALVTNIVGDRNTAVGFNALMAAVNTSGNTAVGAGTLEKADGGSLTAIGFGAASQITTGTNSTVIGYDNYTKPDNTNHTSESNILSLASSNQPEIWGQLAQFSVAASSNATILSIDPTIYSGAVIDYSLQDANGNQRTSVMSLAFDCSANVSYTDPNQIEQGSTGDYSFVPSSNAPLVDLVLTNNSGATSCAITISCRLLKRYYSCV